MRPILISLLASFCLLLAACSSSNKSSDAVRIGFEKQEALAPASWVFGVIGGDNITDLQWLFSDDGFRESDAVQGRSIEHTFSQPGVYRVRLQYKNAEGDQEVVETEVSIASGSISGTIVAALNSLVDVDTRDPDEPKVNNNSFGTAQVLAATTHLSGVVDVNDVEDFYQVQLQQFQRLNLSIADKNASGFYGQIRFELFNADDQVNPIVSLITDEETGRLSSTVLVPAKANYFIKLSAFNPSSSKQALKPISHTHGNYTLTIEAQAASSANDYALGEVNIMLKPDRQYQAQGLSSKMDLGRIKTLSLDNAYAFLNSQNMQVSMTALNQLFSTESTGIEQSQWQTLQAIEALSGHPDILYAEPNWKRYPTALPVINDPFYSSQWHYNTINVEQAWQALTNRGSSNVVVAVLDTGVLTAHPDLSDNLVAGYDFVGEDPDANDPGDKSINGQRSSFHGTHVAGTIAASAANGVGGVGVAPDVKIMPVRVLGQDGGTSSQIIAGLCFAAQLTSVDSSTCSNSNQATQAADIINLSLGGEGASSIEQAVYDAVIKKGIIVIAAAGNESTSRPFYPAAYPNLISVSAINRNLEQASYSNFGSTIDVAAPGGDFSEDRGILSTWGDDRAGPAILTYGSLQGTSMAAPHVAGVAALMKSAKPELTHNEFLGHLNAGNLTQDIGASGRDNIFGVGLIDAQKAVLEIQQNLNPQILSSNNYLFFNVSQLSVDFVLTSAGVSNDADLGTINAKVTGASKEGGGNWLALNKQTGLGNYKASVDRAGLLEGAYQAEVVVSSSLNSVPDIVLTVKLQVGNPELTANAGVQYVVVIDNEAQPNDKGVLPSAGGSLPLVAKQGRYTYQVLGLKKGTYKVSTGSDLDLDFVICDAGESCGQYPTLEQPKTITISEEQTQLTINMSVNYVNTGIGGLSIDSSASIQPSIQRVRELSQSTKLLQGQR